MATKLETLVESHFFKNKWAKVTPERVFHTLMSRGWGNCVSSAGIGSPHKASIGRRGVEHEYTAKDGGIAILAAAALAGGCSKAEVDAAIAFDAEVEEGVCHA